MASVIGIGLSGIEAGGLVALVQSVAMTGGTLAVPVAGLAIAATVVVAGGATVATVAATSAIADAQINMARPLESKLGRFVVAVHNWNKIQILRFADERTARRVFQGSIPLRRMIVERLPTGQTTSVHGIDRPWRELEFRGANHCVDNAMRDAISIVISATHHA